MASIKQVFKKGIDKIFVIFNEAVKTGTYTLITDNGFTAPVTKTCPARCIFDSFSADDVELLPFSKLIQPTDIKGILPFDDTFTEPMSTKGTFKFTSDTSTYTVEAYELDPFGLFYTLLLRRT